MTNLYHPPPLSNIPQLREADHRLVEHITHEATPTTDQVADWHYVDVLLERDWSRPLVRVLRFFVGNARGPQVDLVSSVLGSARAEGSALVG